MLYQRTHGPAPGSQQAREHHRAGTLDIVVEGGQLIAVGLHDVESLLLAEVLPLQHDSREVPLDGAHELPDELLILAARKPVVANTEVERVIEKILTVGANVELDWQGRRGIDARARRIEGELADADGHAAVALVAYTENPLGVGCHD